VHRVVLEAYGTHALREPAEAYGGKFTDKLRSVLGMKAQIDADLG